MKKLLPILILSALIIPQVMFAAWWNPFSWKIFNKTKVQQIETQKTDTVSEIEKLRKEVEELKNKSGAPVSVATTSKQKSTTNISQNKSVPKTAAQPAVPTKLTNSQIIMKIKPAVVYVETQDGAGSGMIFTTDGYILTNAHVVEGVTSVKVSLPTLEILDGIVIGRDEEIDLAVIKLSITKQLPTVDFGDSDKVEQGDEVFTLGFPFGIKGDVSFKEGTISRRIENYLETSAEIHPGNSGGPLVNRYGQVIGVNTAIYGKSVAGLQLGETIKLAIPINIAKNLIDILKAGRNVVVESQKEKQVKQETVNRSACLTGSEQYCNNLVDNINRLNSNDTGLQNLFSQINQQIESIKRRLSDDITRISSQYDGLIVQVRQSSERLIQNLETSAARSGHAPSSDQLSYLLSKMEKDISLYEGQKQSQISLAQSNADINIAKYEALKTKARVDKEEEKRNALERAKNDKAEYYNRCIEEM